MPNNTIQLSDETKERMAAFFLTTSIPRILEKKLQEMAVSKKEVQRRVGNEKRKASNKETENGHR